MNILPYDVVCSIPKYLNYFWLYKNRRVSKYWYNMFQESIPMWRMECESWIVAISYGDISLLTMLMKYGDPPENSYTCDDNYTSYLWVLMEALKHKKENIILLLAEKLKYMKFRYHKYDHCAGHSIIYKLGKNLIYFVSEYPEYFIMSHGHEINCKSLTTAQILEFWLDNTENMGDIFLEYPYHILKIIIMIYTLGYMNHDALFYLKYGEWRSKCNNHQLIINIDTYLLSINSIKVY